MLVKIVDGAPVDYSTTQLRRDNPQVSFPAVPSKETLAEYGVYEADLVDEAPTQFHVETARLAIVRDGRALVTREWAAPDLVSVKQDAIGRLSARRRARIDAGFDFNGITIPCDAESQRVYTAAYVLANDFPDMPRKWKMPTGFVELDATAIKAMAKAASDFVQSCFDEQAALVAEIEACTDASEIEAILVRAG